MKYRTLLRIFHAPCMTINLSIPQLLLAQQSLVISLVLFITTQLCVCGCLRDERLLDLEESAASLASGLQNKRYTK